MSIELFFLYTFSFSYGQLKWPIVSGNRPFAFDSIARKMQVMESRCHKSLYRFSILALSFYGRLHWDGHFVNIFWTGCINGKQIIESESSPTVMYLLRTWYINLIRQKEEGWGGLAMAQMYTFQVDWCEYLLPAIHRMKSGRRRIVTRYSNLGIVNLLLSLSLSFRCDDEDALLLRFVS